MFFSFFEGNLKTVFMKKIILLLLFVLPVLSQAQNTVVAVASPQEQYCMVLATSKLLSNKVTITIDFGQETKMFAFKDTRLKDDDGAVKNFNSVIDALNYMASQGWQFVNAYVITVGGQNVYHYVLRKPAAEVVAKL